MADNKNLAAVIASLTRHRQEMATAVAALLDRPKRAAAMGAAERRRVLERFTLDHARDRLRAILGLAPFTESQPATVATAQ